MLPGCPTGKAPGLHMKRYPSLASQGEFPPESAPHTDSYCESPIPREKLPPRVPTRGAKTAISSPFFYGANIPREGNTASAKTNPQLQTIDAGDHRGHLSTSQILPNYSSSTSYHDNNTSLDTFDVSPKKYTSSDGRTLTEKYV